MKKEFFVKVKLYGYFDKRNIISNVIKEINF